MAHTGTTLHQGSFHLKPVLAAVGVAILVVAAVIAVGTAAPWAARPVTADHPATQLTVTLPAPRLRDQIQSEYVRGISWTWGVAMPALPDRLQSEYLREIATAGRW